MWTFDSNYFRRRRFDQEFRRDEVYLGRIVRIHILRKQAIGRDDGRTSRYAPFPAWRASEGGVKSGSAYSEHWRSRTRGDIRVYFWSGPLRADINQAADLTVGRELRSSNCSG